MRQCVGGVGQRGLKVGARQAGISLEQVSLGGPLAQFAQNQFHRNARAANNGFAQHDRWIDFNTFSHHTMII